MYFSWCSSPSLCLPWDRGFQLQPPPSLQKGAYLKRFQFSTNVSNCPRQQRIHCPSFPSLPGWSFSWLELEFASMMQDGHHGILQRIEWSLGMIFKLTTLVVTLNMCVAFCRVLDSAPTYMKGTFRFHEWSTSAWRSYFSSLAWIKGHILYTQKECH